MSTSRGLVVLSTLPLAFGLFLYLFNTQLRPSISMAASATARHVAAEALNDALMSELAEEEKSLNLVEINSHVGQQNMTVAKFNLDDMAKLQSTTAEHVNLALEHLAEQKIPLPVSQILGGALFSFVDFSIPMKLSLIGTANSTVFADVKTVGLNQTVHILYLNVAVDVNVITPFVTKPVHLETKTPVAYLVLSGPIPNVYYSDKLQPFK